MPDFGSLRIQLRLNGEVMQDFRPAEMIWTIPALIAYLSAGMSLLPGDLILTGTGREWDCGAILAASCEMAMSRRSAVPVWAA